MRITALGGPELASLVVVGAAAAVIVVAVAVAAALMVSANRRRGTSEVHSIDHYRRTLHTLSDIHSRPSSSVRVIGREETGGPPPGPHSQRAPTPGGHQTPGARVVPGVPADRGFVFGDDPEPRGAGAADRSRGQARAMSAMNRGPRRLAAPVAVIVVVVAVLGIVVYLGSRSHPATKTPPGSASHATTTGAGGGAGTHHSKGSHTRPTVPTTTTTTLPPSVSPVEASATSGTYMAPASHYTLAVTATTAACWIGVTTAAGTTTYAQTLEAGGSHTLAATGPVTVVIGAPTVAVTINRVPVVFPNGFATPFTMTIDVSSSPGSGTTITTTTTAVPGATGSATNTATTTTTAPASTSTG